MKSRKSMKSVKSMKSMPSMKKSMPSMKSMKNSMKSMPSMKISMKSMKSMKLQSRSGARRPGAETGYQKLQKAKRKLVAKVKQLQNKLKQEVKYRRDDEAIWKSTVDGLAVGHMANCSETLFFCMDINISDRGKLESLLVYWLRNMFWNWNCAFG